MSLLPYIICNSCGTIIGDKYLEVKTLLNCGCTTLEAFQSLDITNYCCRAKLNNPIVVNTIKNTDRKEVLKLNKLDNMSDAKEDVISITESFTSLAGVADTTPFEKVQENIEGLISELQQLSGSYIPYKPKPINLELLNSEMVIIDLGNGIKLKKLNRIYSANE